MGNKDSGKLKADLMILDGRQEKNGEITKTDFFNFLNMDLSDYSNIKLTPEEAIKFRNHVVRVKYGTSAAIPMLCSGKNCINALCPLHESSKYPLTKQCLVEARLIQDLTHSYVSDIGVDPDSISEMTLVNKLVECDLLDFRINLGLSGNKDEEAISLLKTNIVTSDKAVSESTVVHPLLDIKEKLQRLRQVILDSFAVTRREKYKRAAALGESENTDASRSLSDLRELYDQMQSSQKATSFDKIKEDAKSIELDTSFIEADWDSDD